MRKFYANTFVFLLLNGCSGCEPKEPCIPWAKIGETYQVEIVQHYEIGSDYGRDPGLFPYGHYSVNEQSCGQGFDIDIGDTVQMTATGPQDRRNLPEWAQCVYIKVDASVEGVFRASSFRDFGYSLGDALFADMFHAVIGKGCSGSYWIGIMPVSPYYLRHSGRYIATDYMLFREFGGTNSELCGRPGSEISEVVPGCWDSWTVRIRDSSGHLLTKDQLYMDGSVTTPPDAQLSEQDANRFQPT
jgi:hypothetical protein